jgi:cell division protein FtsA
MAGVRLEANIHIVTGAVASAHNIIKCANKAGLDVADVVLESLASGEAVLTPEEKELGAALIDIGGGTTDLAIFANNNIRHTFVLAIGGHQLTNDVSVGLRATKIDAEKIKIKYGSCLSEGISPGETIEVPGMGGRESRTMPRQVLGEILEPRVEEIFALIKREIFKIGLENTINAGIVVTGGSSLLEGLTDLAESVFNQPTRLGKPQGIGGLVDVVNNPMYATGVGLVLFGAKHQSENKFRIRDENIFNRVIKRMKKWFSDVV